MKLYTYAIKNSLGQTVEPRYASPHQDPDEAVREFLHAAGVRHPAVLASQAGWHAVPVLTGEISPIYDWSGLPQRWAANLLRSYKQP